MGSRFVVDASVALSWCFEDEASKYGDRVLDLLAETSAVAPAVWPLEITNVLLVAERKKRISRSASARFLAILWSLPISVVPQPTTQIYGGAFALARDTGLSAYDASYLLLALREGLPLATSDRGLKRAATRVDVELV
jgi:predicted nucleic acid-binding protein